SRPSGPFTLSGTVTDGFSGGILPNVTVTVVDGPDAGASVRTDAAGRYAIAGIPAGTVTISVSSTSYQTTTTTVTLSGDTRFDVVLTRGASKRFSLYGTVRSLSGGGIPRGGVSLQMGAGAYDPSSATDLNGNYRIDAAGGVYTLLVVGYGHQYVQHSFDLEA